MDAINCNLVLSNKDEWQQHLENVVANKSNKTQEELLEEACRFDFEFDTVQIDS